MDIGLLSAVRRGRPAPRLRWLSPAGFAAGAARGGARVELLPRLALVLRCGVGGSGPTPWWMALAVWRDCSSPPRLGQLPLPRPRCPARPLPNRPPLGFRSTARSIIVITTTTTIIIIIVVILFLVILLLIIPILIIIIIISIIIIIILIIIILIIILLVIATPP